MTREALPDRDLFGARPGEMVLPDNAYQVKCQSCGAWMSFVQTVNGRAMPLSLATVEERDGVRYALPHWIDCPDARSWSKKQ
jgi:hypothetical protein